jgi:hypothetical protein
MMTSSGNHGARFAAALQLTWQAEYYPVCSGASSQTGIAPCQITPAESA